MLRQPMGKPGIGRQLGKMMLEERVTNLEETQRIIADALNILALILQGMAEEFSEKARAQSLIADSLKNLERRSRKG